MDYDTVYKVNGSPVHITKTYLQEVLAKITKDTTNKYDVYEDTTNGFFCILVANNVMLLADNSIDINKTLVDKYVIREAGVTPSNPQGVTFTLKTTWGTAAPNVKTLSEVITAESYNKGFISKLSDIFMYKLDIDAQAAFTTPLFLSAQPRIFVKYMY